MKLFEKIIKDKYYREYQYRIQLGVVVHKKRKSFKMNQSQLATEVKTTQKIISKIECGYVNVGFDLLCRISEVLKFDNKDWNKIFKYKIK
jgi:transcriptional regulator with XRE-family HTH domain